MCLGAAAASTSPVLDDDPDGLFESLETVLDQSLSPKRPRSQSSPCPCPCAALHRAAAAKARKFCGGNCSCPPGTCKCVHTAVPTQLRCCPDPANSMADNVAATLSLGAAGFCNASSQINQKDAEGVSTGQVQSANPMLRALKGGGESVGESLDAREGARRVTRTCCGGERIESRSNEMAVGAFDPQSLAALGSATPAEPNAEPVQHDNKEEDNVRWFTPIQATMHDIAFGTSAHVIEGANVGVNYEGALFEPLHEQPISTYPAPQPHTTFIYQGSANTSNEIEGVDRNPCVLQMSVVDGAPYSQSTEMVHVLLAKKKAVRDTYEAGPIKQPEEGYPSERTEESPQRSRQLGSVRASSTMGAAQCTKCVSVKKSASHNDVVASDGRFNKEMANCKRERGALPPVKSVDMDSVGAKAIKNGESMGDGDDVITKREDESVKISESIERGNTYCLTRTIASTKGSRLGRGRKGRSSSDPGRENRDRKFACNMCTSTFLFKQNRDRHINEVHLGKRPHKCDHPGCEGAFKNRSGLKQHVRTVHEKARPFKCEKCDSAFGQRNHLTQHVLVVHEKVKMYACQFCGMAFSNVGNRTQHIRRRHSDGRNPRSTAELP